MRALTREIEVASSLARQAGTIILQVYATDFVVALKGHADPITEADKRSNELIVKGLRQAFPDDGIVAEESHDRSAALRTGRVWYVDPLDGTREFIAKNGEFSVLIGLAVDGRASAGVVYRPVGDLLFVGISAQGAWVEECGSRRPLSVSSQTDPRLLRLVVSRSHRHRLVPAMRDRIGIREEIRCGSVGVKIGLLAGGDADLYLEPSSVTSAWDACGPEAVLRGAGGRMTDLVGAPLVYGGHDLRNQRGLVATNGVCHDQVIAAIRPLARKTLHTEGRIANEDHA
jgi:3'(2'), 5'-bisphosphate nucleotidase